MSRSTVRTRIRGRHRAAGNPGPALVVFAPLMVVLLGTTPAAAYWSAGGSASTSTATGTLAAPIDVTVPQDTVTDVPVSWTAGTGGIAPHGYFVTRHTGTTTTAACASSAAVLIVDLDCADTAVPDGDYTYVVTAVYASWTATSVASTVVSVGNANEPASAGRPADTAAGDTITPPVTGALPTTHQAAVPSRWVPDGDSHVGDAPSQTALPSDYDEPATMAADTEVSGDVGGLTLNAGVYHTTAVLVVTGTLTLDAAGDPNAVFVFQTDVAVNVGADSVVNLVNGAQSANVFWVVTGATDTGADPSPPGTILAPGASVVLTGQAFSLDAVPNDEIAPIPLRWATIRPSVPGTADDSGEPAPDETEPAPATTGPDEMVTP